MLNFKTFDFKCWNGLITKHYLISALMLPKLTFQCTILTLYLITFPIKLLSIFIWLWNCWKHDTNMVSYGPNLTKFYQHEWDVCVFTLFFFHLVVKFLGCLWWFLLKYLLWQMTFYSLHQYNSYGHHKNQRWNDPCNVMGKWEKRQHTHKTFEYKQHLQVFKTIFSIAQSSYQTSTHNIMYYEYHFHMHIFMFLPFDKSSFKHESLFSYYF